MHLADIPIPRLGWQAQQRCPKNGSFCSRPLTARFHLTASYVANLVGLLFFRIHIKYEFPYGPKICRVDRILLTFSPQYFVHQFLTFQRGKPQTTTYPANNGDIYPQFY
jgi:hypothetical protein